jgi:hypothetical protein
MFSAYVKKAILIMVLKFHTFGIWLFGKKVGQYSINIAQKQMIYGFIANSTYASQGLKSNF